MSVENIIDISRLKKLIDSQTREKIAEGIGCAAATVTRHYNEDRAVTIDYLKKYAEYFNVSTDYLLGLTNASVIASTDEERVICEMCNYTGLEIETIELLHAQKKKAISENDMHSALGLDSDSISFCFLNYLIFDCNIIKTIGDFSNAFMLNFNKIANEMPEEEFFNFMVAVDKGELILEVLPEEKAAIIKDIFESFKNLRDENNYKFYRLEIIFRDLLNEFFVLIFGDFLETFAKKSLFHDNMVEILKDKFHTDYF